VDFKFLQQTFTRAGLLTIARQFRIGRISSTVIGVSAKEPQEIRFAFSLMRMFKTSVSENFQLLKLAPNSFLELRQRCNLKQSIVA